MILFLRMNQFLLLSWLPFFLKFIIGIDLSMFVYVLHDKYMHKRIKIIESD